jgi:hypothetical protein
MNDDAYHCFATEITHYITYCIHYIEQGGHKVLYEGEVKNPLHFYRNWQCSRKLCGTRNAAVAIFGKYNLL